LGSPATNVPKSTPGHGGARPGAGRKPGTRNKPTAAAQDDAYLLLAEAKAKRETYLAHMAELDYKAKAGELIPADEVAATWTERVQIAKGRLLALPARLSPEMVRVSSQRDAERLIRSAIVEVLRELSGQDD